MWSKQQQNVCDPTTTTARNNIFKQKKKWTDRYHLICSMMLMIVVVVVGWMDCWWWWLLWWRYEWWFFVGASKSRTHFNLPKFNNNNREREWEKNGLVILVVCVCVCFRYIFRTQTFRLNANKNQFWVFALLLYSKKKKKMLFFWYPIQLMKMRILSSDVCGFYRKYIFIYSFRIAKIKKTESKFIRVYITLGNFFFCTRSFPFHVFIFLGSVACLLAHAFNTYSQYRVWIFKYQTKTRREWEKARTVRYLFVHLPSHIHMCVWLFQRLFSWYRLLLFIYCHVLLYVSFYLI